MTWLILWRAFAVGTIVAFAVSIVSACFLEFGDPSNAPLAKQITAASLGVFAVLGVACAVSGAVCRGVIPGWIWRGKQGQLKRSEHPVLYWLAVTGLVLLLFGAIWLAVDFVLHGAELGP